MSQPRLTLVLSVAAALAFCTLAAGDAGDLDPTFDGDGKVVTDFGKSEFADGMAIQPNGKIVVVGHDTESDPPRYYLDFVLARYLPNGSLDSTFGGGRVRTDFGGGSDLAHDVVSQPDGKLVVAGEAGSGQSLQLAVARYNDDGSLDPSFDGDGKAVITVGQFSSANAVARLPDGRIVVAGDTGGPGLSTILARLDANGVPDATFGNGGVVMADLADGDDFATSLALQRDGKIVIAGSAYPSRDLLLARFNTDGSPDPTFDGDGRLRVPLPCCALWPRLALQPDGKILVAAGSQLLRYTASGAPDSGFGANGKVEAVGGRFDVVALQADGRIVVAGNSVNVSTTGFQVDRFQRDGSPDPYFNTSFVAHPGLHPPVAAVGLQTDRKIVVAGSAGPDTGHMDFVVLRLLNPAPQAARCRVPSVRGKKLAVARRSIARARCSVGEVARRASRTVRKGRVMSQRPKAGRVVPAGTKVRLVVSRGSGC